MKLLDQRCSDGAPALSAPDAAALLAQVPLWTVDGQRIERTYAFQNYPQTIDFVNTLAAMIHLENHHPELTVRYRHCIVAYTTHSAGNALSLNDFICAAKADAIYEERTHA